MRRASNNREKGYTLLEYCAGAAIVLGVVFGTLQTVSGNLTKFLTKIGAWADSYQIGNGPNN